MKKYLRIIFLFILVLPFRAEATLSVICSGHDGKTPIVIEMLTGTGMEWEYLDGDLRIEVGQNAQTEIMIPKKFVEFYRISETFVTLHARGFDGRNSTLAIFYTDDDFEDRKSLIEFSTSEFQLLANKSVECTY